MGLSLFSSFLVINAFNIATENSVTPKPYRFPVYPVNECPRSENEFKTAAQRRNCTRGLRYLCAPNKYISSLIEFCTDRPRSLYAQGNCVLLEGTGDLDHYKCVEKFNSSCPSEYYYDEEIYKYPACLEIDKEHGCFVADNDCNEREFPTTETQLNISKMETIGNETVRKASPRLLAIVYIIAVVSAGIILIWVILQKRRKAKKDTQKSKTIEREKKQNEESGHKTALTDEKQQHNPEIDDGKLRQFLSKGEITVCHVRCIIVGCGKAGKTTLLKRLQNVSFNELMQTERTKMVDVHVNSFEVLLKEETIQSVRTKNVSEKSSPKNTTFGELENIPMDTLEHAAKNNNAENEEKSISESHSQEKTLVENQFSRKTNDEDIPTNVDDKIDFEKYFFVQNHVPSWLWI